MAIYNGGLNIIAPDISGKEDKSNKVTAWSATTTDTHYPSEKLVKGELDTKVNTANVLTIDEIQATTDLTGKVASASAIKDGAFTIREAAEGIRYVQFGRLVVVKVMSLVINDSVYTNLPFTNAFIAITLRDNTNGKFSTFYIDFESRINIYGAVNYTAGHTYSGSFAYFTEERS